MENKKSHEKYQKSRLRNLQPHWSVYHTNLRSTIATILSATGDSCVNQKKEEEGEKKKNKNEKKSSFHTICRLPWLLTTTLHVFQSRGSFQQTRDESCYSQHLWFISQKEFTRLPSSFFPSRGQPRSLFANIKNHISVYIYKPNLTTKDPTDFFQSQQYNKSE